MYRLRTRHTAQIRIFKTREIKSRTRRKYQKLPEILQRQQLERDVKIRRNHRMLVNMFSKVCVRLLFSIASQRVFVSEILCDSVITRIGICFIFTESSKARS